ncbi:Acetyltransferase [Corynebacterium provencense]|uniref:Acetyltransferase n=1 Tax=Corynebacterium provencense TaxID=1737425 RepID=A0A2Z3YPX4_9CORY|nr:GNAT family protein [Corynebacterium provencense]AWT26758.1 Acetyltransferase [Corynebacterium provencense]
MSPTIRSLSRAHIPTILEACGDWQELSHFGAPYWRPRSEAELERKVASMAGPSPAGEYNFVIVEGERLVGECSLHSVDLRNRVAQIGVCVWNPNDRHNGYGRFGVEQMVAFGFGSLGLLRLEAWILDDNAPSLGLFRKLGFGYEGLLRQRFLVGGQAHDMHVLGLVKSSL